MEETLIEHMFSRLPESGHQAPLNRSAILGWIRGGYRTAAYAVGRLYGSVKPFPSQRQST
jgi:hypothetical protein